MRIISGTLGGQNFMSQLGNRTHPMGERVRGGLFNALGDIDGLTVLDAFAGSGALSYEAISRGAASALAIDLDKKAQTAIKQNIRSLKLESKVKLVSANCSAWSDTNTDKRFDIVFSCPPYDDLQPKLVNKLTRHLSPNGIYVLDWPGKQSPPQLDDLKIVAQKNYGDAQLVFYKRIG